MPVHFCECGFMIMQFTILEKPPELHAVHDKCVVGTLFIADAAVEVVDLTQAGDVAHHYV